MEGRRQAREEWWGNSPIHSLAPIEISVYLPLMLAGTPRWNKINNTVTVS